MLGYGSLRVSAGF